MKILKEIKQPLLSRVKYELILEHHKEKTPSKKDLNEKITSFLNSSPDLTVLEGIYTKNGLSESKLVVYVYSNKEMLDKLKAKKKDGKKKSKEQNPK